MLTLSFIREHFIYVCESNGVFDDVFGMSRHWAMFKAVVRQTNVQVRRQVSAWLHEFENGQVCFHNPGPWVCVCVFDVILKVPWHVLEKRIDFRTSKGEIVKWHEKGKDHNTKLFKVHTHPATRVMEANASCFTGHRLWNHAAKDAH
jgi:hypothetical protein